MVPTAHIVVAVALLVKPATGSPTNGVLLLVRKVGFLHTHIIGTSEGAVAPVILDAATVETPKVNKLPMWWLRIVGALVLAVLVGGAIACAFKHREALHRGVADGDAAEDPLLFPGPHSAAKRAVAAAYGATPVARYLENLYVRALPSE